MKFISLLLFLNLFCSCLFKGQQGYNMKTNYTKEELKWMLYSINFNCKPKKVYEYQKQEDIFFIQCSYKNKIEKAHIGKDTIALIFVPYYRKEDSLYTSINDLYCNRIYLKNDTFLFPSGPGVLYHELENLAFLKGFLDSQEKQFIKYLKNYHGKMDTWLYNECKARKIKLNKEVTTEELFSGN